MLEAFIIGFWKTMVGTDYPYDLGDWDAAKKIAQLDIPQADKRLKIGRASCRERV